jgi:CheY-like chemotaxis protein
VEDDTEVAAVLAELVSGAEYEVAWAGTAEEGIRLASVFRPDVMLLDMSLPGLSGPRLLAVFRRAHPDVPVIVVTSEAHPDVVKQIEEHGPFAFVQKPFDNAAVLRLVAAAGGRR